MTVPPGTRVELRPLDVSGARQLEGARRLTDEQWLALIAEVADDRPRLYQLPGEAAPPELGRPAGTLTAVGRNDPRPCGSGLKFKRCHGG